MPCYFYILKSKSRNRFYLGHSCDALSERLRKHNSAHAGYTGKAGDWKIVYQEEFLTKQEAHKREMEVKAWKSRKRIEALIRSAGSEHPDL